MRNKAGLMNIEGIFDGACYSVTLLLLAQFWIRYS